MKKIAISVKNVSKNYRLGQFGTGTLSHDLQRWFFKKLSGKDLYKKVELGDQNSIKKNEVISAISNLSFDVFEGEVIGLIGRNGAGKSTLLKLISQITQISSGSIGINGKIASLLEVGTGFHPELTGKENIYLNGAILGMNKSEIDIKFDEIVDFSGCAKYINTPVKRYSSGMMVRLGFAVAAHLEPEVLLVDEVLAVGDKEFQEKCLGKIKDVSQKGRTILFVSHNMSSIRSICSKCIWLENGKLKLFSETDLVVSKYLNSALRNKKIYKSGPLKEVWVEEANSNISIKANYDTNRKLLIPALGFVIHDQWGNPILGNNPVNLGHKANGKYNQKGSISIIITEPKLLDGTYLLSIWFGDGQVDFFEDKECIEFEVIASEINRLNSLNIGYVKNSCSYQFN